MNEVFVPTPQILESIVKGATVQELQRAALAAGMRPMREVALEKVRGGTSTLQEVERVLGEGISEATIANDQCLGRVANSRHDLHTPFRNVLTV